MRVRVFIGVSARTCMNICVYTVFLKKQLSKRMHQSLAFTLPPYTPWQDQLQLATGRFEQFHGDAVESINPNLKSDSDSAK
jgi:hypothetical protein